MSWLYLIDQTYYLGIETMILPSFYHLQIVIDDKI